jgi:thiamine-phosphate pyrophosphorylase
VIRYYITDGQALGDRRSLLDNIARKLAAGIEMIQLRERHLSARELYDLTRSVLQLPNPNGTLILVNDRVDVAVGAGAHGVHLRSHAISPVLVRRIVPEVFQIGVSCHDVDDVRRAADEGASFAVLAPIYPTPGKGPALGLEPLRKAVESASIPVLALGGITAARIEECRQAGAAGIAGISMFQSR